MQRAAVVIGVDRTGDLPPLGGAASGAMDFENWCKTQSIDTTLLTDAGSGKVTIKDIRDAVEAYVNKPVYGQLIVYFSGHGILKSPDEEYWLLSEAPTDQYEAVNLLQSVAYARMAGLRHVVFVSDACRTIPNTARLMGIKGMAIFQSYDRRKIRPKIDQLFATAPGDPAYEAQLADALKYSGLFTRELLEALKGAVPSLPEQYAGAWLLATHRLDPFLIKSVQATAARIAIKMNQEPEIRAESNLPLFLSSLVNFVPQGTAVKGPTPPAGGPSSPGPLESEVERMERLVPVSEPRAAGALRFERAVNEVFAARGREGFESGAGFSIIGARVVAARPLLGSCDLFEEADAHQVRVRPPTDGPHDKLDQPTSVLLEFEDGRGTILASWPGFVGTVLVEGGRVANVNYTPARHTEVRELYERSAEEIELRRALIAAAARSGSFRMNPEQAQADAIYLRHFRKLDPTLGLYSAYAYAQVGAFEQVIDVWRYMNDDLVEVPFDVALLAGRLHSDTKCVPICPMLTQGWARLDANTESQLDGSVRRAWSYLVPSLWTTFDRAGVAELRSVFVLGKQ